MSISRFRSAVATGAGLVVVLMAAAPAAAHVTVSSPDASPGGFGKLVFRVPNESDTASTTALSVSLPADTPFAFVSSKVTPGWQVDQETEKLAEPLDVEGFTISEAVTRVTWTAGEGAGIGPGEFDEFELSVGPFPDTSDPLSFPAVQTYSDGEVAHWDQPLSADGSEPEHPAPELTVGAGQVDDAGSAEAQPAGKDPAAESEDGDDAARAFGIAGLVLGAAGLVVAVFALRTSRSRR